METLEGYCPICEKPVAFEVLGPWSRDQLKCPICRSIPRERALALILKRISPFYNQRLIHESSPVSRGISYKLSQECPGYVASQYYPDSSEKIIGEVFNIDLERQVFEDERFDIVVCLDVMEHVFNPQDAIKEIYRTLKYGGFAIMTFPIKKGQVDSFSVRSVMCGGEVKNLKEPIFHGNPVNTDGSLVTMDYGYEIHQMFATWAPFNVEIIRFDRKDMGIIGELTEVIVCWK